MAKQDNDYLDSFFMDDDSSDFSSAPRKASSSKESAGKKSPSKGSSSYQFSGFDEEKEENVKKAPKKKAGSSEKKTSDKPSDKPVRSASAAVKKPKPSNSKVAKEVASRKRFEIFRGMVGWAKEIAVALILVWFFVTFIAQTCEVVGSSMAPRLVNGDHLIVNKLTYRFMKPTRGEIVIFEYTDPDTQSKELLVKRVVGLPGDKIELLDGKIYINGNAYDESRYLEGNIETYPIDHPNAKDITYPYLVPENSFFLLGDNRASSKDSRYFGSISRDKIIGMAFFRVWPFDSLGVVLQ